MKNTKERILEATFVLMLQKGYNSVSTRNITSYLKITPSLPYRYFTSKKELLYEASKKYFCDRFFTGIDIENISLKEMINIVMRRQREIIKSISKHDANLANIFSYNRLYLDALKYDERFRKYMFEQTEKIAICLSNAIKSQEIKPLSKEFLTRTFFDVWGRASNVLEKKSNKKNLDDIICDIENLYNLIKN